MADEAPPGQANLVTQPNLAQVDLPPADDNAAPASPTTADAYDELRLKLDIITGMSDAAKLRYKDCILKFAKTVAREASRIELADRADDADKPEITASMVSKADDSVRSPPSNASRLSIRVVTAQALAFAMAILTPIFGSELHSKWQWTITIICAIIALGSELYALTGGLKRR